jgi:S1-C subfamily serine protease
MCRSSRHRYRLIMSTWTALSTEIADAVRNAAASVVQVHGRRRLAAGVVVAENLIVTPAASEDETIGVRTGGGQTAEGRVLGRIDHMGLTVVRADGLGLLPLAAGVEPAPGSLAVAIGRTWSGGVMAAWAPVAVVGGPLRTGRASSIERVIRIQLEPHGALTGGALVDATGRAAGIITSMAIRGTAVVVPASLAWGEATRIASEGVVRPGFLGIRTHSVPLPERQRAGRSQTHGLLISQVSPNSPADAGGLLVGDVLVAFDGEAVENAEALVTRLRRGRAGDKVPLTIVRGISAVDVTVTVGQRPKG